MILYCNFVLVSSITNHDPAPSPDNHFPVKGRWDGRSSGGGNILGCLVMQLPLFPFSN
ncbi:MAG: hypothetical protein HOK03_00900 [Thiotrichales bacterium]|nr:hypothetical protein [Thiotrichales bacterium]